MSKAKASPEATSDLSAQDQESAAASEAAAPEASTDAPPAAPAAPPEEVPAPEPAAAAAPPDYHRQFVNGEHSIEVDGKWYPLTGDQPEHLAHLAKQGVPVRQACGRAGVTIDPEAEAAPAAE